MTEGNGAKVALACALVSVLALSLSSEQLTMTTTYPSPVGIYNQIVTTGSSGAVAADTTLNRNAGNTVLVPPTNANGRVGVGTTTPQAKLEVAGTMMLRRYPAPPSACDLAHDGVIAATTMYTACICRPGKDWVGLHDGASPCVWRP